MFMTHLVVLEADIGGVHTPRKVWAWGRVEGGVPGFVDVTYTEVDGVTVVDLPGDMTDLPRLGAHLFTVEA